MKMKKRIFTLFKIIAKKVSLISDFIEEQGEEDNWTYRKWNSGIAEGWRSWNGIKNTSNIFAGWYYFSDSFTIPATIFTEVNYASVNAKVGSSITLVNVDSIGSSKVSFVIVTSQSGGDTWENIYVVGRWK